MTDREGSFHDPGGGLCKVSWAVSRGFKTTLRSDIARIQLVEGIC